MTTKLTMCVGHIWSVVYQPMLFENFPAWEKQWKCNRLYLNLIWFEFLFELKSIWFEISRYYLWWEKRKEIIFFVLKIVILQNVSHNLFHYAHINPAVWSFLFFSVVSKLNIKEAKLYSLGWGNSRSRGWVNIFECK